MQFHTIFVSVLLCIIGSTTNNVKAQTDQVPRIVFNGSGNCTAAENVMIDDIFKAPERRSLIRSRSMQVFRSSSTCSKLCVGYARGTCRSSNTMCNGFRQLNDERNLEASCESQLETYQSKLDTLRSKVSTSCSSYIGDRNLRTAECLNKIEYGEIIAARMWKFDTKATSNNATILQERLSATGYSLCRGTSITIESINDPCVEEAYMQLIGPNGFTTVNRTESEIPYTLFGDTNHLMRGRALRNVGAYTLKITPDNDFTRTKTWQFVVNAC